MHKILLSTYTHSVHTHVCIKVVLLTYVHTYRHRLQYTVGHTHTPSYSSKEQHALEESIVENFHQQQVDDDPLTQHPTEGSKEEIVQQYSHRFASCLHVHTSNM